MDVRNCRKCHTIFNYIAGPQICPQCRAKIEEKFQEVKKYVYTNKGATITQIAADCEVEISQLQAWIREERLVFSEDSPIGIDCEVCGAQIKTGRFCSKCKADMANTLNSAVKKPKSPQMPNLLRDKDSAKMRYL